MDKYIIEIAQGSNDVSLNVSEHNYTQTKQFTENINYDELISKQAGCRIHTLIIQQNDFGKILETLLHEVEYGNK